MGHNKEDRQWLHKKMQDKGYDVGSYEEFEKSIQNKDDADWYYKKASDMGLDVGSREDFDSLFVGSNDSTEEPAYTHEYDESGRLVGGTAYEGSEPASYEYKPEVQQYILENKPDMFKPKTVDMYGAHDKDKDEMGLMREGKLYRMKAMRAASTIGEQLDERIKVNDEALKAAYSKRDSESQGRMPRFVFGAGANAAPKVNTSKDDEEIKNLLAEQEYLGNAKKVFEAAKNDAGFFQGMKDAVDASYLTFGMSDLHNAERVASVQQKLESGQELSESEQSLLTSLGLQQMVNEQYNDLLGRWYNVGMVTADMVPFMTEMAINPLSGFGRAAMRASVKKFGEKGAKAVAAKILSRTIGDVAGAAGMAATSGLPSVMADALERQQGYVTSGLGEGGTLEGTGFEGGEEASEAWRKAFTSRTIENWSEMVGEYFSPVGNALGKGVRKTIDKLGLGKVNKFIDDVNSSYAARLLDDFTERTQWNGALGEFGEEQVGMIADALFVGDTKWSDITDLDKQLDVALGVGMFGTFMSLLRVGGYRTPKYRARKAVEKADKGGLEAFGEELWGSVKELIETSPDEELAANLAAHAEFSSEQMKAAFMYANSLKAQQAVNTYKEKEKIDNQDDISVRTEAAYDEGAELETPYDKHNAKLAVDRAEAALADDAELGKMVAEGVKSPVETINAMAESGKYSDEQIQKAKDYYTAYHRMNGLTDALLDKVDSQIESANREVDANTNFDENTKERTIVPVILRDGRQGYVISGNIVPGEEGSIDIGASEQIVMVRVDGKNHQMNPNKHLAGMNGSITTPDALKEYNSTTLRQQLIDKEIGEIDWNPATPNPKVGDSFEMEGVPVTIVSHDGKGGMFVVPTEEYQSAVGSEKKMQELVAKAQQTQPIPTSEFKNWASAQLDAQEEAAKVQQEVASSESVGESSESVGESSESVGEQVNAGVNDGVNNPEESINQVELSPTAQKVKSRLEELKNSGASRSVISSSILQEVKAAKSALNKAKKDLEAPIRSGVDAANEMKKRKAVLERAQKMVDEYSSAFEELGLDENAIPFVKTSSNTFDFGMIDEGKGLKSAPIRLSQGFNNVDDKGNNHGYGLEHIEAGHGAQIREAGFESVEDFISAVASNYQTIRKGNKRNGENTYLLEVSDGKNNTLFVELAKDGRYWNVNSAGIFREGYSKNKEVVWSLPAVEQASTAEASEVQDAGRSSKAGNPLSGNSPQTTSSTNKDSDKNVQSQEKEQKPFHERKKEDVFRELGETYGEKMPHKVGVTAKAWAEKVAKAQKKVDEAQQKLDDAPIGEDAKPQAARDKAQQELDAIKVQADFWAAMDAEIKAAQQRREDILNPQAEVEASNEPMNADEFVAQQLAVGNLILNIEDYMRETGFGSEEAKAMNGGARKLFSANGMTIQAAGERLMEMDRENGTNFFDQYDPNAGRNALIDILGSVKSRKELNQYIAENRKAQREKAQEGLRNELEKAIMDNYHMSLEEYATFVEVEMQINPYEDVDLSAIDAIFAEAELERESLNEQEYESESETDVDGNSGQSELLSEEQAGDTAGNNPSPSDEQAEGTGNGTPGESEAAQGGSSGRQAIDVLAEAERIHNEEMRRRPLRERIKEWEASGVKVNVIERLEDISNKDAVSAINDGAIIPGWYETSNNEVYIYLPHVADVRDLDTTIIHEALSHKGLRGLLGKEKFDRLCDKVWYVMSDSARDAFINYSGVNGDKRAAADEFMAHLVQNEELTPQEQTLWNKIVQFFKVLFGDNKAEAENILNKSTLNKEDISKLVRLSYAEYLKKASSDGKSGKGTRFNAKKKDSDRRQKLKEYNDALDQATAFVTGWDVKRAKQTRIDREQKRKEDAAEIYESVLKGDFNDVTLQKIDKYIEDATPFNSFGQRISQRLPQGLERSLREGARTNAVDALFSRISESSVPASRRASEAGRREIEERKKEALKSWAIATGNWHTDLSEFTDEKEPFAEGTDSKVYASKEDGYVIKTSFGKPFGKRFRPDIDNVALFNRVFPNAPYEIVGYGEFDGKFARILKQPTVLFAEKTSLTEKERVEYMHTLGFEPINDSNTAFSNGTIIAADLQKSNILKDAAGNVSVIDADMKLHTKDVGGNYTYPPVEADLPEGTRFRRVYHGSGASFDRFDHSFMGTGEGNQSFGWGTYVTDSQGIGKQYAKVIGGEPVFTYKGMSKNEAYKMYPELQYLAFFMDRGDSAEEAIERRKSILNKVINTEGVDWFRKEMAEKSLEVLDSLDSSEMKMAKNRHLYEVEIPDNNGTNYLSWEEPLTEEQKERIKAALTKTDEYKSYAEKYGKELSEERVDTWLSAKGGAGRVYRFLENFFEDSDNSSKAVSELLSDAGFVGMEYPANYYGGGNSYGGNNYVIFNEHDLDIVEHTRFRTVKDKNLIDRLESEPKIKVYRAMQMIDGKLYPPMSAKVDGKLREPIELGKWEEAEERPDLADDKGYFKLDKGNKTSLKARYNPYIHTSTTPLNDQFSSAQDRPELVTMEVEIPESELTSGYKAEKAKDAVGKLEWKAGVVQGKLSGTRTVILSRWDKPIRIVPDSEVADEIVKMFGDKKITMPSNVVTPSLRAELEKRGVPFVETDNRGREVVTRFRVTPEHKQKQLDIINETNPAPDNNLTWIRDVKDIKSFEEALDDADYVDYRGEDFDPSYTWNMVEKALNSGSITVYSSYPIKNGAFVTPSYLDAESYGGATPYTAKVKLEDVAWIDPTQGQLATDSDVKSKKAPFNVRFRFIGERGARNLDKAEEATTRLDNLGVAREMETAFNAKKERIEKLKDSEPVEISGTEIPFSEDLKQYKKNALEYGKTFRGNYTNKDTGESVFIGKNGLKEVLNHDYKNVEQLQSVAAIPSIIENSIYIESRKNNDNKVDAEKFDYYVCGLKIGEEDYTVRAVFVTPKDGTRYYDHKLTKIEKGNLLDSLIGTTPGFNQTDFLNSENKDTVLVSILQTNDKENARKIKMATGWERGADGKWRYEVDDNIDTESLMKYARGSYGKKKGSNVSIDKVIDEGDGLFYAYPELKNLRLVFGPTYHKDGTKSGGWYDGSEIRIDIESYENVFYLQKKVSDYETLVETWKNPTEKDLQLLKDLLPDVTPEEHLDEVSWKLLEYRAELKKAKEWLAESLKGTIVHEIQHAVQALEGFEAGANHTQKYSPLRSTIRNLNDFISKNYDYKEDDILSDIKSKINESNLSDKEKFVLKMALRNRKKINRFSLESSLELIEDKFLEPLGIDRYMRNGGEVEARNVQQRMGMTDEQRRNTLASETEDVAREDQVFLQGAIDSAQNTMRFRVSNRNQEIFVSNAERAVEGIKQEKATPQQWLAMIEKNSGLKAGEDKWLGLSDWLKESDKKSLTKAEILDFINQNKIRIEEVKYNELSDNKGLSSAIAESRGVEFRDAFMDAFGFDSYGEAWLSNEEEAIELYNKNNENKIELDEYGYVDERDEVKLTDWAQKVASEVGSNPINSTRLNYTTEGLENKQEIALTVPTIEPWNVDDEIHFGDAGEGRAVAWIRFGETMGYDAELEKAVRDADDAVVVFQNSMAEKYLPDGGSGDASEYIDYMSEDEVKQMRELVDVHMLAQIKSEKNKKRVLVIDEIQSKRHQEGREHGYGRAKYDNYKIGEYKKQGVVEVADIISDNGNTIGYVMHDEYGYWGESLDGSQMTSSRDTQEEAASVLLNTFKTGIPEAPFDKNWHELAFKRMLRYAAENGFDKVAWTKGEQQAERYNIGGVVSSIDYFLRGDGTYRVETYGKNGYQIESVPTEYKDGQALAEVFGKELATKMVKDLEEDRVKVEDAKKAKKEIRDKMRGMDEDSAEYESLLVEFGKYASAQSKIDEGHSISGDGLRVGGEGMKGFYDKMLPSFVNKYVKKWGTKVQDVELPNVEEAGRFMHSVDVTDAMKESVMEGQTMFRVKRDEAQRKVDEFTSKYNSKPVFVVDSVMKDKVLEAVFDGKATAKEFREVLNKPNAMGGYVNNLDKIIIFADKAKVEKMENILFHENVHAQASTGKYNRLISYLYEFGKDNEAFARWKKMSDRKEYKDYQRPEEFLAYTLADGMERGELEDILNVLEPSEKESLFNLLNETGYEYEEESRRRRLDRSLSGERSDNERLERTDRPENGGREEAERISARERAERLNDLFGKVADMGLDGVLGNKRYGGLLMDIYQELPSDVRNAVNAEAVNHYGGDFVPAMSDYLNHAEANVWDKVVAFVRDALRKVGFDLPLIQGDVKYMLWRSGKPLDRRMPLEVAEDMDARRKFGVTDAEGAVTRFRVMDEVNERFNRQLDEYVKEGVKANTIFQLGRPQGAMRLFLPNLPIVMRPRIINKSSHTKLDVDAGALRNLPQMISEPIFVFKRSDDALGILTEIKDRNGKNVCVAIEMNKTIQDGGTMLEVNDIRSIHGREAANLVLPIVHNNTLVYADKKKGLAWLSSASYNYQQEIDKKDLDSATKIVESFENPKVGEGNVRFRAKKRHLYDSAAERPEIVKKYDKAVSTGKFNFMEAFQDRMRSLKEFMDIVVEATGKKVRDYEDAYEGENQLGSKIRPAQLEYKKKFYEPLIKELEGLSKKYGFETVRRYVYCKSGLERNVVLRQRDADEAYNEAKAELDEKLAKGSITQPQYDVLLQQAEDQRTDTLSKDVDYSGIRGMKFNIELDNINKELEDGKIDEATHAAKVKQLESDKQNIYKDWKKFAEDQVAELEGKAEKAELDALWKKINAATNETLRIDYECGMIDKATYDAEKKMMKYYIPLRNWKNDTAEDVYHYRHDMVKPVSSNQKRAKGRESEADNPVAVIALMAQNAIVRGYRNKMKQQFYAFVANRETELASVRDVWYVKDVATGDWEAKYADTSGAADAVEMKQIMEQFEADMKQLQEQGLAFKGKLPSGMNFRASKQQKDAHVVTVMINGQEHGVYINGDPRVAEAVNGLTNSESNKHVFFAAWDKLNRLYGGGLTSWNPDFIAPNFIRDTIHSSTMMYLDKGPIEAAKYMFRTPKILSQVFLEVSGTGTGSAELHRYFEEFVENGGETGYTEIHTLEDYKKEFDKLMNEAKGIKAGIKGWTKERFGKIAKVLEAANRISEDVNRFNAYVTARRSGESIQKSVSAAKNISVNFNRKGAGFANNSVWGSIAGFMSRWILFFNPSVQGIAQLITKSKMNPKRAMAMGSTILASGLFIPMLNEMLVAACGDGDEDDYWNQSDFKRRNNWLIFTGDGYVSVPLPPVLRELYGMGDIVYGVLTGHITPERAGWDMLRQVQSAIGFVNLIPEVSQEPDMTTWMKGFGADIFGPVLDIISNTNFMGRPIAKWTDYNEYDPEYERVYKGVSPHWVELSKLLNEVGGNEGRRSSFWGNFINPAMMEHLITNYGGGIGKTINNVAGMITDYALGNEDNMDEWRKLPIVPRFYIPNDEKTVVSGINKRYYDYSYRYNNAKAALKKYEKGVQSGEHPEYKRFIDEMRENGEIRFILYFKDAEKRVKMIQNLLNGNPPNKEQLEKTLIDVKAQIAADCYEMMK